MTENPGQSADATSDPDLDSAAGGQEGATASGDPTETPAVEKDPNDWVTGEEPMTAPQASYLQTLCQEAGEEFDEKLSKADASRKIDELQSKTGRGTD